MKILLAVDGSEYTKKMLAYLTTHDELFSTDNRYTLLTVNPQLPPRARAAVGKDMVDAYHQEEAEKVLSPVTKFLLRHGIDAKTVAKVGHAGETISKTADSGKYDLVVITRSRHLGQPGHGLGGHPGAGALQSACAAGALRRRLQRALSPSKQVLITKSRICSSVCCSPIFKNSSTGSQARANKV
jgi:nucleotide-binding universal stress UspA family protein